LMVAVIYLCMSLPLSHLARHLERRMGKGKAAGGAR
jgi:ABC-type amino acid transport system permease subunit